MGKDAIIDLLLIAVVLLLTAIWIRESRGRRDAQSALALSESLRRAILDTGVQAVFVCGLDGRVTHFNPAAQRLLGWDTDAVLGIMTPLEFHDPRELAECLDIPAADLPLTGNDPNSRSAGDVIAALVQCGAKGPREWTYLRRDGSPVPVLLSFSVVRDHNGSPKGYLGNVVDIGPQRRAADAWRAEHERAQRYLDSVNEMLLSLDAQGRVTLINRYGLDLLGYRESDVLGKNWFLEFIPQPDGRERVFPVFQALMRGELEDASYFENHVVRADGTRRLLSWHNNSLRDDDGTIIGILCAANDITERARAQDALRRNQLYLRTLIDNLPFHVWLKDGDGRYLLANRAVADAAQMPSDGVMGKTDFDLWPPSLADDYRAGDLQVLTARRPLITEQSFITKEGASGWVETFKTVVLDDGAEVLGTVGYARDITVRKETESQQRKAVEVAEQMARAKSQFLANMSHEIRTPLNAVLGLAQIGTRDHRDDPSGEFFERILRAGRHLHGVVNDILDFSKMEAGKLAIENRPFALVPPVEDAIKLVQDGAANKGLDLRLEWAPGLPEYVRGDPLRLQQILLNLLNNSVKFTAKGEVGLRVSRDGDWLMFGVTDTGIGMDTDLLPRLFLPFEQLDGATTRRYGGTGLGLTISDNLARLMGGSIGVESTLNKGSRFTLRLPLVKAPAFADPVPQGAPDQRLAGLDLLVVDDMEVNLLILEDTLIHEGATVLSASSGFQALERLREAGPGGFDAVLMDIQMSDMDGFEATRRILELAPGMPVIGVTAHALSEERARCLAAGMVGHVAKPVEPDALVMVILQCVRGTRVL